jgi:hypothetical protein
LRDIPTAKRAIIIKPNATKVGNEKELDSFGYRKSTYAARGSA